MRKLLLKMSGIVFATTVIAIGTAPAARADERIVAKVPFAFIVGDMRLPAGDYVVRDMSDGSGVLGIASADGRQFVCALTIPSSPSSDTPAAQPELKFEKFSNHYFLAGVVPQDGGEREIILTPSMMQREIARTDDRSNN
jgi:hypothetical protein